MQTSMLAQTVSLPDGYYRVVNNGLYSSKGITAYCCVDFNNWQKNLGGGTAQSVEAIALRYDENVAHSDPASVWYITNASSTTECNISAQGINFRDFFSGTMKLEGSRYNCVLRATMSGFSGSLYTTTTPVIDHYIVTSENTGAVYATWAIADVGTDDNNYVSVKPTLSAGGKYYAPYYVSFPFKPLSSGMKVFYVSKVTSSSYELKELEGIVPASTPVLIECSSDKPSDNRLQLFPPGTVGTPATGNRLSGVYFCNFYVSATDYPEAAKVFNAGNMRVWNVENGQLVLSTNNSLLAKNKFKKLDTKRYINANQSFLMVEGETNATLYTKQPTKITFKDTDGSTIATISGMEGTQVTPPSNPTKTGYTFKGWSENIPTVFPESDKTITAQWQINQYTITFDTDGGSVVSPITLDYNATVTPPTNPTKTGYTFQGWDKTLPANMPAENVTVKALWAINQYTITFDTDGGSVIESITQDYNTSIIAPANPTKTGYTFTGWSPEIPTVMPANNAEVKAQWQINSYDVKFVMDDEVTVLKQSTLEYGATITLPETPTSIGREFVKWQPEPDATVPDHDVKYVAVFNDTQYTITFDTDGGTEVEEIKGKYNQTYTKPANPTKPYYVFDGWNPSLPETMLAENITVKAKWKLADVAADGKKELQAGWQWMTFNVATDAPVTVESVLNTGTKLSSGDEIKNENMMAAYSVNAGKWIGKLANEILDNVSMYKIHSQKAQTLTLKGKVMIPSQNPITLKTGWNAISFLPIEDMNIDEALREYADASEGDVIKSQGDGGFATYSNGKWTGKLSVLVSGNAYMIYRKANTSSREFCFPDVAQEKVMAEAKRQNAFEFADNMSVIARVDGMEMVAGDSVVATVNGEIRGIAAVEDDNMVYLPVMGDKAEMVTMSLMRNGIFVAKANAAIAYSSNDIVGSMAEPTSVTFVKEDDTQVLSGKVVAISNIDGTVLPTTDMRLLPAGIYIVKTDNNGQIGITKVTKK